MKIFVDSLLLQYQTNRSIEYEFQRNLMACSPYRHDLLYSKSSSKKLFYIQLNI